MIVVCGDDGVAQRVREELAALGVQALCVCQDAGGRAARAARAAGAEVVIGAPNQAATWDALPLAAVTAIGLLEDGDLDNLEAALLAAERAPGVRIVVRIFESALAGGVEELLQGSGVALSATVVAAPAFLQAALSGNAGQRLALGGRELEVAEVRAGDPDLVLALAPTDTPTDVLPVGLVRGTPVLGLVAARVRAREANLRPGRVQRAKALAALAPFRMRVLLLVILAVGAVSTTVFALGTHHGFTDALYFTATTMATVGYGDINLVDEADWLKYYAVALMATTAVLLASFLAFVTGLLLSTRLDRALGRFPRPREGHVVVCGLGKAGTRILGALHELGVPCIGVERSEDASGIALARSLSIPVVLADVRSPEALEGLHLEGARALMAVTDDDLANLRTGLTARTDHPELNIVLRIFDPELAERVDRGLGLDVSRSVAALAAPAFAAALLDRPLSAPLPLSSSPLRTAEAPAPEATTVGALEAAGTLRVLAVDRAWLPPADHPVLPGAQLAVVGTRDACDRLLREAE